MTRPRVFRRQGSLFESDQARLPFDGYAPPEPRRVEEDGEQLPLFEGKAPLVGEVEVCLADGDFRGARTAYERLRESYPADESVSTLEFLLGLPDDLWERSRSDDKRLGIWASIASRFVSGSTRYRALRDGFFRRFLEMADALEAAMAHPEVSPDIANHLVSVGDWLTAREVVRDVLLAGYDLRPLALEDEVVSELLGEEGGPEWLASLGAIRRLWPRVAPDAGDSSSIEERLSAPLLNDDREKALDFWFCLCVSGLGGRVREEIRYEAHRRMKRLHPELHEEFMTGRRAL